MQKSPMAVVFSVRDKKTIYCEGKRFFVPDSCMEGSIFSLSGALIHKSSDNRSVNLRSFLVQRDIIGEERINVLAERLVLLSRSRFPFGEAAILVALHLLAALLFWHRLLTYQDSLSLTHSAQMIFWMVAAQSSILMIHELSHCATARRLGLRVDSLGVGTYLLLPAMYSRISLVTLLSPQEKIAVFFAGLLVQAEMSLALLIGAGVTGSSMVMGLFWMNLTTIAFNLMPLSRLDGYRIAVELLQHRLAPRWSQYSLPAVIRCANLFSYALIAIVIADIVYACYIAPRSSTLIAHAPAVMMIVITFVSILRSVLRNRRHAD